VTVPEGASIFEIAARLQQAGFDADGFLNAAVNQAGLVADLDPGARSLEGYLFPDTYRFARKATPAQIVAAMVRRFRTVAGQLGLKENVHTVVTMASLIERETAVDAERPLVASVFVNRMAKKMPLMTDPAVIYGLELEGRWRGAIYQSDLSRNTPYNTYLHTGLPPGPVDNPGAQRRIISISWLPEPMPRGGRGLQARWTSTSATWPATGTPSRRQVDDESDSLPGLRWSAATATPAFGLFCSLHYAQAARSQAAIHGANGRAGATG
jgi:hypothetical protein